MLIRYLELENFLGHESERLELPEEGMFLLSGESGAGKSSLIVDAIAYALFGHVATRSKRQAELLNRDHAGEEMGVRVMFEFEDGGRLIIARGIDRRGAGWARAYEPDPSDPSKSKLLAEGAQPVQRLLRKRIGGMSWQQFYAAFVARQSEISMLTSMRGRERKDLVHRMLGMRELEKASELISAGRSRARAELEQLERSLGSAGLAERQREVEESEGRLAERRAELERRRHREIELERSREALDKELGPLRDQAERRRLATELERRIELLDERLSRHRRAQQLTEGRERLADHLARQKAQHEQLTATYKSVLALQRSEEKRTQLQERISELRAEISSSLSFPLPLGGAAPAGAVLATVTKEAPFSGEDINAEWQRLNGEIKHLSERVSELGAQRARIAETGECYACLRGFESEQDHQRALADIDAEIKRRNEALQQAKDRSGELKPLLPLAAELKQASAQLGSAQEAEVAARSSLPEDCDPDQVVAEGKAVKAQIEQLSQKLAVIEAASADLDPELEQQRERAAEELAQLGALAEADEGDLAAKERELNEISRELAGVQGSLPELAGSVEQLEARLEQLRRDLAGYEHERKELKRLRTKTLAYESLQTFLRAYQRHLALQIRPALEEIGSEMLQRISSGRHRALKIGDDYEIEVESAEGYTLPASMLSGGELIRANICLRLALTRLVSQRTGIPVGFLILDEPLPSQDPGHVERILELLESLKPFYRQQFMISHVGGLESSDQIDHVISFAGESGPGQVELLSA